MKALTGKKKSCCGKKVEVVIIARCCSKTSQVPTGCHD